MLNANYRTTLAGQRWVFLLLVAGLWLGGWPAWAVTYRWSASSNRIYITGPGTATLTDAKAALDLAPLESVSPGVWHLRANLVVEDGALLNLHGTSTGGDVDELRLQSNNQTNQGSFVFISADWGSINIQHTKIVSWDDAASGPDTEYATYGRAYLGVRSSLAPDGVTALESRMDILDSDIGYLGYDEAESYGLSWKVIGEHPDAGKSIFDYVNVYGDILNNRIHHNYFGVYTFGHYGGRWANNECDHNVGYGFDPHDDSDYVVIENNNVHHNGWDGIVASKRCDHLIVRNNISFANGQNGILLHRNSNDCLVENNQSLSNGTSGIVLTADWRCLVRSNLCLGNVEAGIRLDLGSADNLIAANQCASNAFYGLCLYKSTDAPEPNDDGRPKRNVFAFNQVQDNQFDGVNLADSDDNTFATNQFSGNGKWLSFERGFRNRLDGNEIPDEVIVNTLGSVYDAADTYVSNQLSLRVEVDAYSAVIFEDGLGRVFDPDEKSLGTTVAAQGSSFRLTSAQIGQASQVVGLPFWVRLTEGEGWINPTLWNVGSPSRQQWQTKASSPTQSIHYTIGGLDPNRVYVVSKNTAFLQALKPGPTNALTFSDVAGTTNRVTYAVEPGYRLAIENTTNGIVLKWNGGEPQTSPSVSPPDWQPFAPGTNQTSVIISPTQSMEFFRTIQVLDGQH